MENQIAVIDRTKQILAPAEKAFKNANPYELSFAQEFGFAVMAIQNNPYLLNCTPDSIKSAVVSVALTGISLNPALKYAYLVPRKSKGELKCILDISYMGMIKILTDAGAVKYVDADVVHEEDNFTYSKGTEPKLDHKYELMKDRGPMIGAYAIAYFRDGGYQFELMRKDEIEKVRNTSESWKAEKTRQYSPWETWTDEMWKKTVLKRLFKILPKTQFSEQLISALSKEHENEMADISDQSKQLQDIFDDTEPVQEVITDPKPSKEDKAHQTVIKELNQEEKK